MMLEAEDDVEVVGEASDGIGALNAARIHDPDVLLMDVRMPQLDGIEATGRLVRANSRTWVLVLTTFDLDEYVCPAMKLDASGFLHKDATREQLASAVRTVANGETLLAPAVTPRLLVDFCRRPPPSVGLPPIAESLSPRELELLRMLARGMSNSEIAADLFLSDATVKSHVARILNKLEPRDRT